MQIGVEAARAIETRRIFVVEPDEIKRTVLQFILHDENETHELTSLDAALEKGMQWRPDLVLLSASVLRDSDGAAASQLAEAFPGVRLLLIADDSTAPAQTNGVHGTIGGRLTVESVRAKVDAVFGRGMMISFPVLRR